MKSTCCDAEIIIYNEEVAKRVYRRVTCSGCGESCSARLGTREICQIEDLKQKLFEVKAYLISGWSDTGKHPETMQRTIEGAIKILKKEKK